VINGTKYSGAAGDGYKEAARKVFNSGKPLDPYSSNVDPYTRSLIQDELDNLKASKRW